LILPLRGPAGEGKKAKGLNMSEFAMIFPGQGSQSIGMLSALSSLFPSIKTDFHEASHVLGYDVWQLTQEGPVEKLDQTLYTQPALLAASVALFRLWTHLGGTLPSILAGHSLGEYSALVIANALSYPSAIRLVSERGRLMQEAVPSGVGGMAAIIGLSDEQVQEICENVANGKCIAPANYNAHGQVVIAGHGEAVERAIEEAKKQGAKLAKRLSVSVPSHCQLMKPAADEFAILLEKTPITKPTIPVINNVDIKINQHPDDIRDALVRQLYKPVRWVETIEAIAPNALIIECGPGKVLAGLVKRIDKNVSCLSIDQPDSLESALKARSK
jgi:[acyl-carrier-protein] S-malonyltransferase